MFTNNGVQSLREQQKSLSRQLGVTWQMLVRLWQSTHTNQQGGIWRVGETGVHRSEVDHISKFPMSFYLTGPNLKYLWPWCQKLWLDEVWGLELSSPVSVTSTIWKRNTCIICIMWLAPHGGSNTDPLLQESMIIPLAYSSKHGYVVCW